MSWWWRTKPRSALKTVLWFNEFGILEGENWDVTNGTKSAKDQKPIHPVRRKYIYNAHSTDNERIGQLSFSEYLTGEYDSKEAESDGRQDKHAFELFGFGYVDKKGIINVTKMGRRILEQKFDEEDFLKQLLKLRFPNPIQGLNSTNTDNSIFPLQLLCLALERFEYLNRSELVLLFGCNSINDKELLFTAIQEFRDEYNLLPNKNKKEDVRRICASKFEIVNGDLDNKISSYYSYVDAFCRSLIYTGIFKTSGRSDATQIRVPDYSKTKFNMLLKSYVFTYFETTSLEKYMDWFGDPDSTQLPWDNEESLRTIIDEKLHIISNLKENEDFIKKYPGDFSPLADEKVSQGRKQLKKAKTLSDLKDVEKTLVSFLTGVNEKKYIDYDSKTPTARKEILKKYDEIIKSLDDMGALWLEVNTWKSLLAINGNQEVIRNFQIEEDLTPKSFAPGIGNTPDMEMRTGDYIIIPEVSLMTGVRQWEHEASSVIDHVFSFIENNMNKKVIGLFITSSVHRRTRWQFFILNKESWIGEPVPVVPLTIKQYKEIIKVFYDNNLNIEQFVELIEQIRKCAFNSNTYDDWFITTGNIIDKWKFNVRFAQ